MWGKRKRKDVAEFILHFTDNLLSLHQELKEKTYKHGYYEQFKKNDPKPRDIHKASIRDRLVHHTLCRILAPYFERYFIYDSYSCRLEKGTHRAVNRLRSAARKVSHNNTRTVWILKGDIRKFFANIDHKILKTILQRYIPDTDILRLLEQLIDSFHTPSQDCHSHENGNPDWIPACAGMTQPNGLPLGNLTSQLFINIYMNEFDQFVKRELKMKHYFRYSDDFIIVHERKSILEHLIPKISEFLKTKLKLALHPDKLFIKTLASGMDFLGWIQFPHHRLLRTSTKRRMFRKLQQNPSEETIASYLGLLSHGNTYKLAQSIQGLKNQRVKNSKIQRF